MKGIPELNRELATRVNEEARINPQSPYTGKFVGIVNGRVAVVADDLDELERALERDYDEAHEIARTRK